jgi:hypothetical protein
MSAANGTDRDDSRGIERLRAAIEDVAVEIESRRVELPVHRSRRPLRLAFAAAAVLIALLIGTWWIVPSRTSEVEVLELRVHGRDVRARIVDDTAPGTIIVMPQPRSTPPVGVASLAAGGAR